jgi:large subunit ribosomal protein L16
MFTPPKTVKFRHRFLPKIKPGKKAKGNNKLNFGDYGLQSKEVKLIGHREIESARKVLSKFIKKIGRIRIVPCFDYSRSKKAVATRMGSGKGSIED